jgi:G3E family GTPase
MVHQINPLGKKIRTSFCDVDLFRNILPVENSFKLIAEKPLNNRPDINSCVLKSTKSLKTEELENFLKDVSSKSYRCKGYVNTNSKKTYAVQTVFDQIQMEELKEVHSQSEIISMSYDLTVHELKNIYRSYTAARK